jgi:phosphonate transport system permease protein
VSALVRPDTVNVQRAEDLCPRVFHRTARQTGWLIARIAIGVLLFAFTVYWLSFNPLVIVKGIFADQGLLWMARQFWPPGHGGWLTEFAWGLLETLAMAFLGTLLAFVFAIPFGFFGAKNVIRNPVIHFAVRRVMDFVRSIDVLIWALMCIHVVGMGPFAGILAITITDTATMGKLFSEAVENADRSQIEGTRSTGANTLQIARYAFMPQMLPVFMSNGLYFFESNVRSASILGVLGAGGIGMELYDRMRVMNYEQAAFIILMILGTVAIIDTISRVIRQRFIAAPAYRP